MAVRLGGNLLNAVKASPKPRGPVLSLPVGSPVEAILRPVATRKGDLNAEGVHLLAEWRNRHVRALMKFRFSEDRMMLVARCTDIHLVSLDATLSRIQKHAARWLT